MLGKLFQWGFGVNNMGYRKAVYRFLGRRKRRQGSLSSNGSLAISKSSSPADPGCPVCHGQCTCKMCPGCNFKCPQCGLRETLTNGANYYSWYCLPLKHKSGAIGCGGKGKQEKNSTKLCPCRNQSDLLILVGFSALIVATIWFYLQLSH